MQAETASIDPTVNPSSRVLRSGRSGVSRTADGTQDAPVERVEPPAGSNHNKGTITIEFMRKPSQERLGAIFRLNGIKDPRWHVQQTRRRLSIRMPDDLLKNTSDGRTTDFHQVGVETFGIETWEAIHKSLRDEILRQYKDKWKNGERDPPMLTEGSDAASTGPASEWLSQTESYTPSMSRLFPSTEASVASSRNSINASTTPEEPRENLEVHFKAFHRYALHLKRLEKLEVQGGKSQKPTFVFSIPADHILYSDLNKFKERVVSLYGQPDNEIFTVNAVIFPLWNGYRAAMEDRRRERLAAISLLSVSYTPKIEGIKKQLRQMSHFKSKPGEAPLDTFEFILENKDFADRGTFLDHVVEVYGDEGNNVFENKEVMRSLYRLWKSARAKALEAGSASASDE